MANFLNQYFLAVFNRLRYTKRVTDDHTTIETTTTVLAIRDSGTSSPINPDTDHRPNGAQISSRNYEHQSSDDAEEEMSDSNDSVFSSGSSIDSILNFNSSADHLAQHDDGESLDIRDLYVGGCYASWRDGVITVLNQRNITYRMSDLYIPPKHEHQFRSDADEEENATTAKPLETCSSNDSGIEHGRSRHQNRSRDVDGRRIFNATYLNSSRVLLFVISGETRSMASMTLAAHCIGLGLNVVLCVQMLPERCRIGDDQVNSHTIIYVTMVH